MTIPDTWTPTTDELAAVVRYRKATAGIPDCLEFPEHDLNGIDADEFGGPVPGDPTAVVPWGHLRAWVDALDALQSDLGIRWGDKAGSDFARAFVNQEAGRFLAKRRRLIEEVARFHCPAYFDLSEGNDAGPDVLSLSNGYAGPVEDDEEHAILYHFADQEERLLDAVRRSTERQGVA